LRESTEAIEREGIRRAKERAAASDFRLMVLDGSNPIKETAGVESDLVVRNKADLVPHREEGVLFISTKSGEGMEELIGLLSREAAKHGTGGDAPLLTRARHRYALEETIERLNSALEEQAPELAAEHLRVGLRSLGRITGAVDLDDLLDVVFRDFCIGK
jgi:tRNA modification GTPase